MSTACSPKGSHARLLFIQPLTARDGPAGARDGQFLPKTVYAITLFTSRFRGCAYLIALFPTPISKRLLTSFAHATRDPPHAQPTPAGPAGQEQPRRGDHGPGEP